MDRKRKMVLEVLGDGRASIVRIDGLGIALVL